MTFIYKKAAKNAVNHINYSKNIAVIVMTGSYSTARPKLETVQQYNRTLAVRIDHNPTSVQAITKILHAC